MSFKLVISLLFGPSIFSFQPRINYSVVAYVTTKENIVEGSLIDKFLKGDDVLRKSRLKMIANIVNGPWIVRKADGEQAIYMRNRARPFV